MRMLKGAQGVYSLGKGGVESSDLTSHALQLPAGTAQIQKDCPGLHLSAEWHPEPHDGLSPTNPTL